MFPFTNNFVDRAASINVVRPRGPRQALNPRFPRYKACVLTFQSKECPLDQVGEDQDQASQLDGRDKYSFFYKLNCINLPAASRDLHELHQLFHNTLRLFCRNGKHKSVSFSLLVSFFMRVNMLTLCHC